jgi:hypothetical protein
MLQSLHAGQAVTCPPGQPLRVIVSPVAALSLIGLDITTTRWIWQIANPPSTILEAQSEYRRQSTALSTAVCRESIF